MPEVSFEQDPDFLKLFNQADTPSETSDSEVPTFDPTNYLETGEPRTKPVDLSIGTPNEWRQPSAPNPISAPSSKPYGSTKDMMNDVMNDLHKKNPTFTDASWVNPTLTPQSITRKYKDMSSGYIPGVDLDNFYGEKESSWKTLGKGLLKLPASTAIKVGQGLGYVAGLLDPTNWGSDIISKAADNGFSKVFDGLDDKLKNEWLPTYQEANDRNKGFWARAFTDGDFWMDDAVDGLAFMASAWIPGIALSKLGLGLKTAQALSKLRIGVSAAEAAVEGAGGAANYLSKANSVFKTSIDKFNAWALATASESMFESVGVKNNVMQALNVDPITGRRAINPTTGLYYTEKEKKQIAGAAAQNTFILNAALLSGTNAFELNWLGKAFGAAEGGAAKGLIGAVGLGDEIGLAASPTKFLNKFISGKRGAFIRGGLEGIAVEGFAEENGQLAIQRINEHYGTKGKIADAFNIGELINQYVTQTGQALIGNDPEAAANIGIGGLLGLAGGGYHAAGDFSRQQATNQAAVSAFNSANQAFLKFGNIYKSEEITLKDPSGNEIKTQKILKDENNNPILDAEKLAGITASYRSMNGALDEAAQTQDKFKKDVLRDTAFGELVLAHINAGIEDTLMDKLDAVKKATPEDLAKLGFSLNKNVDEQINKYKSLTAAIIEQNKLMNSDIMFDGSQEDVARKYKMTSLAAEQAVHKNLLSEINNDTQKLKNQLLTSSNTSLTDGLVDQINDINDRIKSQKETFKYLKKMGLDESAMEFSQTIIDELEEEKANLLKDNEETVKTLKKGKGGKYVYEKQQRNEPGVSEQYDKKVKLKGEVQNHIRQLGLEWAKYADTIDGKKNFLKSMISDFIKAAEQQDAETKEETKTPEAKSKKIEFVNEQGEDDDFTVIEGKTYQNETSDGKVDLFKIIKISDDGKTITLSVNNEGAIDIDAQEFAKIAKDSDLKEVVIPVEKPKVIAGEVEHPKELESDVAIVVDLSTYSYSDKKPKFEDVGFFKTFGKHYKDDADTKINDKYGSDRFFSFTAKYNVSNGDYVLQVVTKNNDDFKILQPDFNPDDIKVIVLKKSVDKKGKVTYSYIDQNNQIIPDDKANKDNIIYRSLANAKNYTPTSIRGTLVDGKYIGGIYTVDETTPDDLIQQQIDAHIKYQDELVKRTKKAPVFLNIVDSSPGIQKVMKTKDGEIAKAPVEGRVIESDPDWSNLKSASNPENNIVLRVNTTDGALAPGLLAGRAILQEYYFDKDNKQRYTNKTTRVFNRELLANEKETIINALSRWSELFGRDKKNPLTLPEQNESGIILEYLRGMLNWSAPYKKGQSTNKFMWISSGLHVGDKVYKFDRETIEKNKDAILKNTYHHVNNKMLWKTVNKESFQTIKFINNKAVLDKSYKTYEEYLLSKRENGEVPPVYTSLPLYDSEIPQRTNVFLMWRDPANEEAAPIGKIERTYKEEYKTGKKTRKKYTAVDRVIDSFINYKTKEITIYGVTIRHAKKGNKLYVNFYDPSTNKSFSTAPFSSVKNLIDSKYKIRSLIYKLSGYNPYTETSDEEKKVVKKGNKVIETKRNNKVKGDIILKVDEENILSGDMVSSLRNESYHDKFYKGDGIYQSESGNLFDVEFKGKITYKNGRIYGKNVNMSKAEMAKELGFDSWNDLEKNAKWGNETLVKGYVVFYYSISPVIEGQENVEGASKPVKKWGSNKNLKPTTVGEVNKALELLQNGKTSTKLTSREQQLIKQKELIEKTKDLTKWVNDIFKVLDEKKFNKFVENYDQKLLEKDLGPVLKNIKTEEEAVNLSLKYFLPKFIDAELAALGATSVVKKTAKQSIAASLEQLNKSTKKGVITLKDLQEAEEEESVETSGKAVESFNIEDAVNNAVQEKGKLVGRLYEQNPITGESRVALESTVEIPNGNIIAAKTKLKQQMVSEIKIEDEEAPPFRMPIEEMEQLEDFKKLNDVMGRILPQFGINKMSHLIHGKAWGSFYKGAIYIFQNAGVGTGFHEAFEAVWASYLTDNEQESLANEFKDRTGTFYNPFTKQTKEYQNASMYDVREMLAEELSKYLLDVPMSKNIGNKTIGFFKQLWNSIKSLFGLSTKDKEELDSSINNVFKKIKEGGYRNATPIRELNKLAPAYKAVGTLTQKETAGVLEGINYYFFKELYSNGNNINSILGALTKEESNILLSDTFETSFNIVSEKLSELPSSSLKTQVDAYKADLYKKFKENLERYGVMFSELDIDEEDVSDTLGIRDSITVDPRKMTNQNIRILLASFPEVMYKNNKPVLVKNDFRLPRLINGDKAHITLLNELSNIVAIINKDGKRINVLDQMFNKLDDKFRYADGTYRNGYYWIKGLKSRLKYEDDTGIKIDPSTLSKDEMQLRISFIKSFNNVKSTPDKTIVGENGEIYNFNPLNNLNVDRVRQEWSNNLKLLIQNKKSSIVKLDATGKMVIDRSSPDYAQLVSFLNFKSQIDINASLIILNNLGITFSLDDETLSNYEADIRNHAIQILTLLKNGEINTVSEIFGNQLIGGRINDLLSIEATFTSEDNVLSYLNANGEPQYAVGIPSLLSNTINTLNNVKNHTELINTCPWLGYFDEQGNPILNPYQLNSELLKKDGILFDKKGNRRKGANLTHHVISGMGLSDDAGNTTANLQFPERVSNKIHYLLNNIVFSNINSDKSTEFGIGIPGKQLVTAQDIRNFLALTSEDIEDEGAAILDSAVKEAITSKYVNQLTDEMASALLQKDNPQYIQYYQEGVNDLGHFRDILGPKLIAKFKKEVLGDKAIYTGGNAHIDFLNAERIAIETSITKYLYNKILETTEFLKDLDIFEPSPKKGDDRFISDAIDNEKLIEILKIKADTEENPSADNQVVKYYDEEAKESVVRLALTENNLNTLAGLLAINEELLATEQHKLIYGHPAMYKDFPKRANGATSTKESFVEDDGVISWMDNNMVRNDGKQRSDSIHQTTKVISFKDQNVVSLFYKDISEGMYADFIESGISKEEAEKKTGARFNDDKEIIGYIYNKEGEHTGAIKEYMNLNEANAMAWGMPDAIRDMLFQTSKLTAQQDKQWDYEIAYEKVARSQKDKSDPGYVKYSKEELKAAKLILSKEDPGYIFQVLKPQYFGYATTEDVTHPVFLKHAVQPKFFRHVEGTQYESLYIAAQNNQVDIIGFESGHKVGNVTDENGEFTSIYNDKGGVNIIKTKKGYDLPAELPKLEVYSKFYGIQVEQSSKSKNSVVRGTQITKLIMVNFFNNGKPINEELGTLIKDYNDTLKAMIRLGKIDLLKELGLTKVSENKYEAENLENLVNILRKEARNRELPDNMIDAINALTFQNGKQSLEYKFDTLINREKIDNILNSIVDSRVISAKMNGRSSVQVASTLYESNPRGFMYLKDGVYKTLTSKEVSSLTDKQKESVRMTSNDLKFYYNKNGKVSKMECYVAWPFKDVTPEDVGLKLENGVYKISEKGLPNFDKELLNIIGFRIPTQAPNSIENIIIKGFTPASNGDMIVVPSEIVGKAGSDFDIDKLNLYFNNHVIEGKRAIRYVKPGTETKAQLQNKFIGIMSELISRPENYAQLVSPNSTATLKGLATEINDAKIKVGTKSLENEKSPTYLRTFIGSSEIRERYLTAKRMVGIAALHSTFHSMAQVSGLKLNPVYKAGSLYYLIAANQEYKAVNIKLDHYAPNEDGLYDIGHRRDVEGQMISDLFSEAVSGFVDGSKDPFVFDLNFSMNSAGTWFYLQHLGVPTEQIAYLFNQPILDEYFKELGKNRSNFKETNGKKLSREELFYKVIAPYYNRIHKVDMLKDLEIADKKDFFVKQNEKINIIKKVSKINEKFETFKLSDLKKNIDNGFSANPEMQISVLMNYLEYEAQARQMGNFMQAISYDNKKTRTTQENMLQVTRWERSKSEEFINNPDAVLENTFIGEMKEQKEDVFNMFRDFFITLSPEVQQVFQPMYDKLNNPEFFASKDDMVNLLNKYQNFVITYLLHTTAYKNSESQDETLNGLYQDLFTGQDSLAKRLSDYKNSADLNISDNLIIKELIPLMTDDASKTDNISLFRNKMDTFEINNVIESLDNLKEYAIQTADNELLKFVNDLAKFAILQSGMQSSYIDFKKVLSVNVYSDLVKTILDQFSNDPQIDTSDVWRNFHQNNFNDRSIVPKAPTWSKIKNKEILINPDSSYALNDYMIKYARKSGISKAEYKRMKKDGTMSEAFEPILFENTNMLNKKGKLIFRPISKRGNGRKMTEIYKDDRNSIFEKNKLSQRNPKGSVPMNGTITMASIMKKWQEAEETPISIEQDKATKGFKLSIDKKGKDQGKADLANALITYPNPGTSSYKYLEDAKKQGIPVNDKIEPGPGIIAMVSVNGNNKATDKQIENTYLQAREIIETGGTVIMDSTADANRSWNASGEALVQEQLGEPTGQTSKGYNYWGNNPETTQSSTSEKTVTLKDGNVYTGDQLNTVMLLNMGYSLAKAGDLIKKYKC